jgi:hypothetical protein
VSELEFIELKNFSLVFVFNGVQEGFAIFRIRVIQKIQQIPVQMVLGVPAYQRAVLSAHTARALSSRPVYATITNAIV